MHSDHVIKEARKLLSDEQSPKRRKLLGDILLHLKDCSEAESRKEDEEWFHGMFDVVAGRQGKAVDLCLLNMFSFQVLTFDSRPNPPT